MARVLLGSLSLLGAGCLVPQPDDVLPDDPIYRNHPPYFVASSPAYPYILTDNCEGTRLEFRVNVADPDVSDSVRVRYYVDFPQEQGFRYEEVTNNSTNSETRPNTVIYDPIVRAEGSLLQSPRIHIVEAVVFDGTLSPSRTPEPRALIPDAGVNPSFMTVTRWVVETEECANP